MVQTCYNLFKGICRWTHDEMFVVRCARLVLYCLVSSGLVLVWSGGVWGAFVVASQLFVPVLVASTHERPILVKHFKIQSRVITNCLKRRLQLTSATFYIILPYSHPYSTNRLQRFLMHFAHDRLSGNEIPPAPEHGVHQDHHRSDSCERKPARVMFKPKHTETHQNIQDTSKL